MSLCAQDRNVLDTWTEHGIPDDRSTRDYALTLILRLWSAHKALRAEVDDLVSKAVEQTAASDEPTQDPLPFGGDAA